jgi:predicted DNA-binding ribbon-helix-helix protein
MMYAGDAMHRTQIYFEEAFFEQIRQEAVRTGTSISAYIRSVLQRDIDQKRHNNNQPDLRSFAGMWQDNDIDIDTLRDKAWK